MKDLNERCMNDRRTRRGAGHENALIGKREGRRVAVERQCGGRCGSDAKRVFDGLRRPGSRNAEQGVALTRVLQRHLRAQHEH